MSCWEALPQVEFSVYIRLFRGWGGSREHLAWADTPCT